MKICTKCKLQKPLTCFYKDSQKKDGYMSHCKSCKKDYLKQNRGIISKQREQYWQENKEVLGKKAKDYRIENKETLNNYSKDYAKNNRHKVVAHQKIRDAVRYGIIKKPEECSRCRSKANIEAHHVDYEKPLDVVWLCRKCHRNDHVALARNKKIGLKLH